MNNTAAIVHCHTYTLSLRDANDDKAIAKFNFISYFLSFPRFFFLFCHISLRWPSWRASLKKDLQSLFVISFSTLSKNFPQNFKIRWNKISKRIRFTLFFFFLFRFLESQPSTRTRRFPFNVHPHYIWLTKGDRKNSFRRGWKHNWDQVSRLDCPLSPMLKEKCASDFPTDRTSFEEINFTYHYQACRWYSSLDVSINPSCITKQRGRNLVS